MVSLNCSVDFDSDFWAGFDAGIKDEWDFSTTTSCHEVASELPQDVRSYKNLANKLVGEKENNILQGYSNNFTLYLDFLLSTQNKKQIVFLTEYSEKVFQRPLASGVAYPSEDLAFVENNFAYSTATLSHEILHLALEEGGYDESCYADKVHENQHLFSIKTIDDDNTRFPIIKKFDC